MNTLTGGGGHDIFEFDLFARDNVITDFDKTGSVLSGTEDQFDFQALFGSVGQEDASLDQLLQTGYLAVDGSGNVLGGGATDTVVRIDFDGTAGEGEAYTAVTLQDVALGTTGADADNWLV